MHRVNSYVQQEILFNPDCPADEFGNSSKSFAPIDVKLARAFYLAHIVRVKRFIEQVLPSSLLLKITYFTLCQCRS